MVDHVASDTQVVIAHYNEDLEWLSTIFPSCIIYTKGNDVPLYPDITHKLRNIGREGHTYLNHIITHYDGLAPVTCFLQGRVDDHTNLSAKEILQHASLTAPDTVTTFPWRDLELFDHWNGIPWSEYPSWSKWSSMETITTEKTPAAYWTSLLGFPSVPDAVGFQPGALFAVHRDTIRRHSKAYYQSLMDVFFLGDMEHVAPETGHYLERFWLAIWCPGEYVCWQYQTDTAIEERNKLGQLARGRWWVVSHALSLTSRGVGMGRFKYYWPMTLVPIPSTTVL
jgi:Protein of unknown function (DUF3431)